MKIGVPREIARGERRVALVPDTVARLTRAGSEVLVEQGAGEDAFFLDQEYREAGATVLADAVEVLGGADIVVKVRPPVTNPALGRDELDLLRGGATLIGILQPALAYARSVIMVPGYGLAVSQAQHQVRELADEIEKRGGEVKYAIHPVAGRMPGHMNVLLAEANVPYDKLYEMERINGEFDRADVALVVGANDIVNPAARTSPGSPLYGMPILNVEQARSVIVLKRGMSAGFSGMENELFSRPKTSMLFGDAKRSLSTLVSEIQRV